MLSKWSMSGKKQPLLSMRTSHPQSLHTLLSPTDLMLIASNWLLREKIQTENSGWNWLLTEENVRVKWPDSTTFHVGNYTEREMLCFENKDNLTNPQLVFQEAGTYFHFSVLTQTSCLGHRTVKWWDRSWGKCYWTPLSDTLKCV